MKKWIPVPDPGQKCLVRIRDVIYDCATLVPACLNGEKYGNHGEHCEKIEIKVRMATYNPKYGWPFKYITHWMPVPSVEIEENGK